MAYDHLNPEPWTQANHAKNKGSSSGLVAKDMRRFPIEMRLATSLKLDAHAPWNPLPFIPT